MNIALVTYNDQGNYAGEGSLEDRRLFQFLQDKGLQVSWEIWTNPAVQWQDYDAVVLKSPWDYFDQVAAFRQWLSVLESQNVRVLNPTDIVRWNHDKRYLLDIEAAGFAIVPTRIIERNGIFNPDVYFRQWATDTLIVKPAVSGGAKNTFFVNRDQADQLVKEIDPLLLAEAYLVQPFMPEIQQQGEWSLIFFNGQFSHGVLKVPKHGDFRSQHFFGGAILPVTPPAAILEEARQLVAQFAPGCLYARVDGLHRQGTFCLMELELIEPMLYLQEETTRYENYYRALQLLLNSSKPVTCQPASQFAL